MIVYRCDKCQSESTSELAEVFIGTRRHQYASVDTMYLRNEDDVTVMNPLTMELCAECLVTLKISHQERAEVPPELAIETALREFVVQVCSDEGLYPE